ncbi:RlpA-like double-psi beta-barrel-protein domain-containing protein-containing protein [Choanephora cucurbitarum]|nr:RlpA-like double-psi beta-barrel-protein domain-containing protein-containing protein [Choanephora cucurbitarum]
MKGFILTAIFILSSTCFSKAESPNDMFYHHHPDLINVDLDKHFAKPNNRMAQANDNPSQLDSHSSGQANSGFSQHEREPAQPEQYYTYGRQNGNDQNGYYSSPQPAQRNGYDDYYNARNNYFNTFARNSVQNNGYDPYYRNYQSNNQGSNRYNDYSSPSRPVNKIAYNDDGSINWEKSKSDFRNMNNRNQAQQVNDKPFQGHNSQYSNDKEMVSMGMDPSNSARGIRLAGALPEDGYHRGVGTYYDLETRVSSCGKQNQNSELVVALNSQQMGKEAGRNNSNCGKQIEVTGPSGKSVRVTVVDECKTCPKGGLDLSPAAFEEIGDFSHGSIPIKWKFTE